MLANGTANAKRIADDGNTRDFWPVVKLFCPLGAATWLLSELDPEDEDIAFGLCDLGFGCPEIGSVRLSELAALQAAHPGCVWTLVSGDDDTLHILRGFHTVNRLGYFITEAPWHGEDPMEIRYA